jgi:hypothetical protein
VTQPTSASDWRWTSLHLLGLWSFAVAEPLYEVLRRNREFFVAHRSGPLDLFLFSVTVSLILPLAVALVAATLGHVWLRAGRWLHVSLVATLAAAIASQILAGSTSLGVIPHFAVAATAGALAATAYARVPLAGTFVTALSPATIVFPALFMLHPAMAPFVRPKPAGADSRAVLQGATPPIVLVVFDQLPLTSLMTDNGQLDLDRYPGFASVARESTWYRNASTVAELTGWAVPPILTGLRPRRGALPTTADYPNNLFTMLADDYRFEVEEPITDLCPDSLCPEGDDGWRARLLGSVLDAGVVYLHLTVPADLRDHLPSLTQDWKNFLRNQHWQQRWIRHRDDDRRAGPRDFIAGVSADDPQPTLYFLHALLPHEPYLFLSTGQQFTEDGWMAGLAEDRWVNEEWPVMQAYRRHLVQLSYVDALVGQLVARLKSEGLWDKALVVLTADHGVSFRPGRPFRMLQRETLPDIAPVPLFVKLPGQREGSVSDRNVQSVDIIPTIADAIDADLPWQLDGVSALGDAAPPPTKRIQHQAATRTMEIDAADLARRRDEAARRKVRWFGTGRTDGVVPIAGTHAELVGRKVSELDAADADDFRVLVEGPARYLAFDPSAAVVPAVLSGLVDDGRGLTRDARLAIAVNGVVRATTTTYKSPRGAWTALISPLAFHAGRNDLEVFVIDDGVFATTLRRAYALGDMPETLNLVSNAARTYWAVGQEGFHGVEPGPIWYRWTMGEARVTVPPVSTPAPKSLRIGLWAVPPGGTPLRLTLNDCVVFDGNVEDAPWYRTFALDGCRLATPRGTLRIAISSRTFMPGHDGRTLGLAVGTLNLFDQPWPPADAAGDSPRAALRAVDATNPISGPVVTVALENIGDTIWLGPDAIANGPAGLELTWFAAGGTAVLARTLVPLVHTFYPGDRERIYLPTAPPRPLPGTAWDLAIQPLDSHGRVIPTATACRVRIDRG